MKVFTPAGRGAEPLDPANFTGHGTLVRMVGVGKDPAVNAYTVSFEPGTRTAWHTHTGTQLLLVTAGMAKYMNKNVPGIFVPDDLIEEMATAPKGERLDAGIRIAGRMIRRLREEKICDGVHIMAIGKEDRVPDILRAAE